MCREDIRSASEAALVCFSPASSRELETTVHTIRAAVHKLQPCSNIQALNMAHSTTSERVDRVKDAIRLEHLQHLQYLSFAEVPSRSNNSECFAAPSYFGYMKQWSERAKEQISAAIAASASGGIRV